MSIAKPYTFTAGTKARANEVNADFDTLYTQVNTNISAIADNASDIEDLESTKADVNGSSSQTFSVANPVSNYHAVNKQSLTNSIANSIRLISGLVITKDSNSPNDTIIVDSGSCYDSTDSVCLTLSSSTSKQNSSQGASATYYVHLIGNANGTTIDVMISASKIDPALPSGYTLYRCIGSYTTNSSSQIDIIKSFGIPEDSMISGSATVVKTYRSGHSGYRIWSDGFKECWGQSRRGTIYFPITFTDTSTMNVNTGIRSNNSWDGGGVNYSGECAAFYSTFTTTEMYMDSILNCTIDWYVRGY